MTKRIVHLASFGMAEPRVMAWIEANGLDPHMIPLDSTAAIDGDTLTVTEWLLEKSHPDLPPHKTLANDGESFKKAQRTVPLLSAPENHGL